MAEDRKRPPRSDETPHWPSKRPPWSMETPAFGYLVKDPEADPRDILPIEPVRATRADETPIYVLAGLEVGPRPLRFGDWLVRRGLINRSDLFQALNESDRTGVRLGDALVSQEVLDRDRVEEEACAFFSFSSFQEASPLTPPPAPRKAT